MFSIHILEHLHKVAVLKLLVTPFILHNLLTLKFFRTQTGFESRMRRTQNHLDVFAPCLVIKQQILKNSDQPVPKALFLCKPFLCAAFLLFLHLLSSIWVAFLCWIVSRCFPSPLDLAGLLVKGHLQAQVIFFCIAEAGFLERSR